jgi:hypothetical protein
MDILLVVGKYGLIGILLIYGWFYFVEWRVMHS